MIRNLRETTLQNTDQDWLKTNLTKFTRLLQGERDLLAVSQKLLSELAITVSAQHGVLYTMEQEKERDKIKGAARLKLLATYGYKERKNLSKTFKISEGLVGQCAFEKQRILLTNVPSDYIQISSGLGEAAPLNIIVLPILFEGQVKAIIELAAFERFGAIHQAFLEQLTESVGIVFNSMESSMRTEELLKQSQSMSIGFDINLASELPPTIHTDTKRLQQVLKNLLSNAFKFTEKGKVGLNVEIAAGGWSPYVENLNKAGAVIAFSISDTGIGIPADKQKVIFEAFQQADGSTSRTYGGTGLGLAISREIAVLLGGELKITKSEPGKGSIFTLYLPQIYLPPKLGKRGEPTPVEDPSGPVVGATKHEIQGANVEDSLEPEKKSLESAVISSESALSGTKIPSTGAATPSDAILIKTPSPAPPPAIDIVPHLKDDIKKGDKVLLIVEDDITFAEILFDKAHEKNFKAIVTTHGNSALSLAKELKPDAITLDIQLPDTDGWAVLDALKSNIDTIHIPVHIISVEEDKYRGLHHGAFSYLEKPVNKEALDKIFDKIAKFTESKVRKLLIVEDNKVERKNIVELVGNSDVEVTAVGKGKEALKALKSKDFDCVVLDLRLPDIDGLQVMEEMQKNDKLRDIPIIVYSAKELTKKEKNQLDKMARSTVVKGVQSIERLLDETTLFLHRVSSKLPEQKRKILEKLHQTDSSLTGKKVLIVDDDVRNIFALTSALERHNMNIAPAENGESAIEILKNNPDIDIVLMDIMMPEMDGYETMQKIRKISKFQSLPIIALTAKAMKGDREKCLEAGASDYLSKPVNIDQLLSLMRVWLYR